MVETWNIKIKVNKLNGGPICSENGKGDGWVGMGMNAE
jgi:hypothetical protein